MIKVVEFSELEEQIADHGTSVYAVCRRITRDPEAAMDAFQETFLAFTKRSDSLDQSSDIGPWLRETARRCSLSVIRRRMRDQTDELSPEHDGMAGSNDSLFETVSKRDSIRVLQEEFATLDPNDQKLLNLAYVEGLTHREIARVIGCPSGSTHTRLRAARSRLQSKLRKRGLAAGILLLLLLFQENKRGFAATPSVLNLAEGKPRAETSLRVALPVGVAKWIGVIATTILILVGLELRAQFASRSAYSIEQWRGNPEAFDEAWAPFLRDRDKNCSLAHIKADTLVGATSP